jgi:hypothetical protein
MLLVICRFHLRLEIINFGEKEEIHGFVLSDKYAPLEIRRKAAAQKLNESRLNKYYWLDENKTLSKIFSALPDPENLGKEGEIWKYGAFLHAGWKLTKLKREFKGIDINWEKVVSNHRLNGKAIVHETPKGKEVDWDRLSEALRDVSYKKISEISDAAMAISSYVAKYVLAYNYTQAGETEQLVQLNKKQLEDEMKPLKDKVIHYFIENKTLPQMAQMSDQWHTLRAGLLKSSGDHP